MIKTLRDFLNEERLISRKIILIAALVGMFAGAALMFMVALIGLLG